MSDQTVIELPARLSWGMYNVACRVFRDSADQDYVVARLSWKHSIYRQFAWSASQAIEKYVKCALLLNSESAKFQHDWLAKVDILKALSQSAGKMFPEILCPDDMSVIDDGCGVYDEPLIDFLFRLSEAGNAGVRYQEFAFLDFGFYDLHKFDTVCFLLRGLCFPLDGRIVIDNTQGVNPVTARFELSGLAKYSTEIMEGNYAFFPDEANGSLTSAGLFTSPVAMLVLTQKEDVLHWLSENTLLSKNVEKIRSKVLDTKKRNERFIESGEFAARFQHMMVHKSKPRSD
jgi:hypothetical protein